MADAPAGRCHGDDDSHGFDSSCRGAQARDLATGDSEECEKLGPVDASNRVRNDVPGPVDRDTYKGIYFSRQAQRERRS